MYPNREQTEKLEKVFGICRFVYNCALEERKENYRKTGKGLSYNFQAKELTEIKDILPEASCVYAQTLQVIAKRLDFAYKSFFNRSKKAKTNPKKPSKKKDGEN